MKYSTIMNRLPEGVREASRVSGVPHATMSRLKRGYNFDQKTLLRLMDWAGVDQITISRDDLMEAGNE